MRFFPNRNEVHSLEWKMNFRFTWSSETEDSLLLYSYFLGLFLFLTFPCGCKWALHCQLWSFCPLKSISADISRTAISSAKQICSITCVESSAFHYIHGISIGMCLGAQSLEMPLDFPRKLISFSPYFWIEDINVHIFTQRHPVPSSKYLLVMEQRQVLELNHLGTTHNSVSVEDSCCPDIDSMASECFMWCIKYLMWYWTKNLALDWGGNTLVFIFLLLRQNSLTLWLSLIVLVCWNSNWISVAPVVYHCGIMDYMLQWGP